MKKLVIDRQKWLRGEGGGKSMLLRPDDNKMCCLGFYCVQNGLSEPTIINLTSPQELRFGEATPNFLRELVVLPDMRDPFDSELCNLLMNANDAVIGDESASVVSEEDRERQIKRLFEEIAVEVEFTN